jgi:hypothetical protein
MKKPDFTSEHKRLVVYLPSRMHNRLKVLTAQRGTSMNKVAVGLLTGYLSGKEQR